jgi:hypothetical protein
LSNGELLSGLVAAAVRAPSGDNTQPWRFVADPQAGLLSIFLDETRDPSPMNAGQRMARIAIGAALENVLRTASANGIQATVIEPISPALATVRITAGSLSEMAIEPVVTDRVTNRRSYDGRAVGAEVLAKLRDDTPEMEGVKTIWIVDRDRVLKLAPLIGRADAAMFGEPRMRRAFLNNVRFDAPATTEVDEGLSLASLELTAMDRFALRLLRRLPNVIVRLAGIMKVFATKTSALVESASGLCLVVAPDTAPRTDLVVGRVMQRAWLALTNRQLAVQPMMSLCVLENVLENGGADVLACLGREKTSAICDEFRNLIPLATERAAFLMRFGFAPPPSGRTGRFKARCDQQRIPRGSSG